jgi:hypothetical protein
MDVSNTKICSDTFILTTCFMKRGKYKNTRYPTSKV